MKIGNNNRWWKFTPWVLVRKRILTDEHFDWAQFARKYKLDTVQVRRLVQGSQFSFWPELCIALSEESGLSRQFFENLSLRYFSVPPSRAMAAALPLGNPGQFFIYYLNKI